MPPKRKSSLGTEPSVGTKSPAHTPAKRPKANINWSKLEELRFKIEQLKQSDAIKSNTLRIKKSQSSKKSDYEYDDALVPAERYQPPPFHDTSVGEVYYRVTPSKYWLDARRYRQFKVGEDRISIGDYVLVRNTPRNAQFPGPEDDPKWIAKVVEIRAGGERHVYIRILWMYSPDEIHGGRRPYHARYELLASNHMDVIHGNTVEGRISVVHWNETAERNDVLGYDQFFYRQTYDFTAPAPKRLSQLPRHCIDKRECNPDEMLIQCDSCLGWLHASCLEQAAVKEAYSSNDLEPPVVENKDAATKRRGRPKRNGVKRASSTASSQAPVEQLFSAELTTSQENSLSLTVTDHREGHTGETWQTSPIICLLCAANVERASSELPGGDTIQVASVEQSDEEVSQEASATTNDEQGTKSPSAGSETSAD
ncbi:hypothetical protein BU24DRAFT_493985 [Aaosphaeria arxii CBS 175.79]|uniref:BAH domain-containing protein n=1 Tax=Aaosphaeria arxii CBS 175.79 TaxID=1450172 RepID=A0A6A5XKP1_9PLEO|nr:uncharacterized protein BU24DRAFT_493985 [Aaosphaeria arxii CBS 175.79]KAF2013523.1 hypothetical protein BU24DRAFT_493985 [Aaosphaeria arxii CBS 175.79]